MPILRDHMGAGEGNRTLTASLGSSVEPLRMERSYSSEGTRTDPCCPWITAVDRCLGHVRGTAGEGEHGSGPGGDGTTSAAG